MEKPGSRQLFPVSPLLLACFLVAIFPRAEAASELDQARAALAEFLERDAPGGEIPPALTELHNLLVEAATIAEKSEALAEEVAKAEETVRGFRERSASWRTFDTGPPYPVGLLDATREEAAAAAERLASASTQAEVLEAAVSRQRRELEEASATARRLGEEVARENVPEARAGKEIDARTAAARARLHGIQLGLLKHQIALNRSEIERLRSEQDLALRKLRAIGSDVRLAEDDLEASLARLRSSIDELNRRKRGLQRAASRLGGEAAKWDAFEIEMVDAQIEMAGIESELWQGRAAFLADRETNRATATALVARAEERLEAFNHRLETGSSAAFSSAQAARARLRAAPTPQEREALEAEVKGAEKRVDLYFETLRALRSVRRLAEWFSEDLGSGRNARGVASDIWRAVWGGLQALWRTELYSVEDAVTVDGKRVVGHRGITVGKVVYLIAFLFAGYLALRWGTVRFVRALARRLSLTPEQSALSRRWFLYIGSSVLALYALHAARIPLTAFAFLGGALAIGVGFATQNLIRNFISGLIILFERPFRVNDVLEVGGINGKVATIGLRASVIRHWDGIETLIPNSALLEGNVTNWTHSDKLLRDTLRIGVAYGSDPRRVSDILLACAAEHRLVLREPEPKVYFEDFGESSLVFRLDYWIDFSQASKVEVSSDLRFKLSKALSSARIETAFPTREIKLSAPLPVHINA